MVSKYEKHDFNKKGSPIYNELVFLEDVLSKKDFEKDYALVAFDIINDNPRKDIIIGTSNKIHQKVDLIYSIPIISLEEYFENYIPDVYYFNRERGVRPFKIFVRDGLSDFPELYLADKNGKFVFQDRVGVVGWKDKTITSQIQSKYLKDVLTIISSNYW